MSNSSKRKPEKRQDGSDQQESQENRLTHSPDSQYVSGHEAETGPAATDKSDKLEIEDPADALLRAQQRVTTQPGHDQVLSESDKTNLIKSLQDNLAHEKHPEPVENHPAPAAVAAAEHNPQEATSEPQITPAGESEVFLKGRKLVFPKNTNLFPGDTIDYRNKKYIIKPFRRDPRTIGLAAAFLVILLGAVIVQGFRSGAGDRPTLFGVVVNSSTNEVISSASVSIPELGLSGVTDEHGSFAFEGLKDGLYQIKIAHDDFASSSLPITLEDHDSRLLCTSLVPLITEEQLVAEDSAAAATEKSVKRTPRYGTLRIKTNLDDAAIIVNGKTLGSGNQTFKRMKPGNHVLQLEREGYETFEQAIKITVGQSTEVAAILSEVEPDGVPEFTAAEYMEQANQLFDDGNYDEAIGYYTLAIAKDNSLAEAYQRQAEANLKLGRKLKAQADLLAAAKIYSSAGQYRQAIVCYDRIIGFVPSSTTIFQRRGWARILSGDFEAGLSDMETGLGFDEENWQARFQFGRALYFTGNYKDAEKQLKKIRKYDEELTLINGYLALTYLGKGDESDARKYLRKFSEKASSEDWDRMSSESAWPQLTALAEKDD